MKNELSPYIRMKKTDSKLILWFSISKHLMLNNEELLCGIVYIPPHGSRYANPDPYLELQNEFDNICTNNKNIILLGDFNSRTSNADDFVQSDEFICDIYGNDDLFRENTDIFRCFAMHDIPLIRKSADKIINMYGYQLIEFCKNNNIFIINGRIGKDAVSPELTCKNSSTVDYVLSTAYNFEIIKSFSVLEFNMLYSDAHCPLSIDILIRNVTIQKAKSRASNESTPEIKLWDENKCENFTENLDFGAIEHINSLINLMSAKETIQIQDINTVISLIENLFLAASKETFGFKRRVGVKNTLCNGRNNKWFNRECKTARNTYHTTRKQYNKYKTLHLKKRLKAVSKQYKNTIAKNVAKYKNDKINKLRNLKQKKPKDFWKVINSINKKEDTTAPLHDLYEYFKTLNADSEGENTDNDSGNLKFPDKISDLNIDINLPFTENEIIKAIKKLKNNKSHGIDGILNEHLKKTLHVMSPTYTKLFNIIFDTGLVPESWSVGNILPIYKNKGSSKLPENYRPITLLSCFGKLFTSILNDRINKYLEDNSIINSCQAGFRKGYATTDNLFILQSLIEIARVNKNKLFCAFIDFKQAFDKVWRVGLWNKLLETHINGKCLTFIKNMYENIKSRITTSEGNSIFFPCQTGVRQGEILSPLMFSIYLNDLESYLHLHMAPGITCETSEDVDYVIFLKLFLLLFADDTVLFSNSREDLQVTLNVFETYCDKWKLTVNITKTKVLVFSGGKTSTKLKFHYKGEELEVVNEYKYLGIFLSRTGSFLKAKRHIADQATNALFSLLRKIRTLDLPIDMQVDLFNKLIKPILLYGCEIWGFGNLDIIERVQLKFFKHILNLKRSTPSFMIYGELGVFPIYIDIQSRMVSFWTKVADDEGKNETAFALYKLILRLNEQNKLNSKWLSHLKHLICSNGFGNIWNSLEGINKIWFAKAFKQKLKDQYVQNWAALVEKSSSGINYRIFKNNFEMNNYFSFLTNRKCRILTAFRTRNHRFPVEIGRWTGIPLNERVCWLCNDDIGDEYHYIMKCRMFNDQRRKFIKPYYIRYPNVIKFNALMTHTNKETINKLSSFIEIIMQTLRQTRT